MDVVAVSSANPDSGYLPSAPASPSRPDIPAIGDAPAAKAAPAAESEAQSGRALEVFRKELMVSGSAQNANKPYYPGCDCTDYKPAATVDDVATAAIDTAGRAVAENADVSSYALLRFRQRVQSAATVTRQSVGNDADIGKVDSALGKIESGLESLDGDASRNVESSASVLSVNSVQRQRSVIRIRTQEGDLVRLDVKQSNRLSAQDVAVSDENGSASRTELATSSRSRLNFSVRGDINDAELTAIKAVFTQAESIAGEFFDGDLGAAFSQASGLQFDAGQLSNVNLRFRSREVTSTSFAQVTNRIERPAIDAAPAAAPATPTESVTPPASAPAPAPVVSTEPSAAADVKSPAETGQAAPTASVDTADGPTTAPGIDLGSDTFLRFFDLLGDFLRNVADGFDRISDRPVEGDARADVSALKFHFSQAFKLEIFKSVLESSAPDNGAEGATALATSLIDGLPAKPEVTA
jgi:hypothetical protein